MEIATVLYAAPVIEPITIAEAKDHLRIDSTAEDALIAGLITAARQYAETFTKRALITQTWDLVLDDEWPAEDEIQLPFPPLQSVTSITYTDDDGVDHTFASTNYFVDTSSLVGRIVLKGTASWPTETLREANAIRIRYVAGYGASGDAVPRLIRQAMMLMIGLLYENREGGARLDTVDLLLWPLRVGM